MRLPCRPGSTFRLTLVSLSIDQVVFSPHLVKSNKSGTFHPYLSYFSVLKAATFYLKSYEHSGEKRACLHKKGTGFSPVPSIKFISSKEFTYIPASS